MAAPTAQAEVIGREAGHVVARARVELAGNVVVEEAFAETEEQAIAKALHTARDKAIDLSFTPELRAEARTPRRRGTPLSPELLALVQTHGELARVVDAARPERSAREGAAP